MIRQTLQNIIFQTAMNYYDVLLAQELLDVNQQALKFAESLLDDVRRKRSSGVASDYDVLRAEVEVSNARAELIRQQNAYDIALTSLLKTMGISQESKIKLSDKLSYRDEDIELKNAVSIAMCNRPDLYQLEFAVYMQRETVRLTRSLGLPRVDAFFVQKWANPDPHSSMSDEWGDAWTAGLSASFPIFDAFQSRGKLIQEKARLRQAEMQLRNKEEIVLLEVKQAILGLQNAKEFVESQKTNLRRAEEGLRLIQTGYRQGVNTELSVMDAQTALTRTKSLYYQALYSHMAARLNLRRVVGILSPEFMDEEFEKANNKSIYDQKNEKE